MSSLAQRILRVRPRDVLHVFYFLGAIIPAFFLRRRFGKFWLVCDSRYEARDNGFYFFQYLRREQPQQKVFFALDKSSIDNTLFKNRRLVIPHSTFTHWVYYLAAEKNISSQKDGNPNPALCFLLENSRLLKSHRTFLQHGITKDNMPWLYYNETHFDLFITAATPEHEFVCENFGYPSGSVQMTGFARYDNIEVPRVEPHQIAIIPTWRDWIADGGIRMKSIEGTTNFVETTYFKAWKNLLESKRFNEYCHDNNINVVFYPHRNMQPLVDHFKNLDSSFTILDEKQARVRDLIQTSSMLITDYSSVFFDFIYLGKPISFYQFDADEFRKHQYNKGYFDYDNNPFSQSHKTIDSLIDGVISLCEDDFHPTTSFMEERNRYFTHIDNNNCQRIYEAIKRSR